MTFLEALLLGIVQGLTEFLPISSSGHLVVLEHVFTISLPPRDLQAFDILLHGATLLALLLSYYTTWRRILLAPFQGDSETLKLLGLLSLATLPAAVAGFLWRDIIATFFRTDGAVAASFLVTATILILSEHRSQIRTQRQMTLGHSLLIGIAQALALLPGLSRSGLTMGAARSLSYKRSEAVEFSFLLAAPITAGAVLLTLAEMYMDQVTLPSFPILATGFLGAFVSGILAISFLRRFVHLHSLAWFAVELIPLSIFLFLY